MHSPSKMNAVDLHIGDRITVRSGLRTETRTVDLISYKKNTVEVHFTNGSVRTIPNGEKVIRK